MPGQGHCTAVQWYDQHRAMVERRFDGQNHTSLKKICLDVTSSIINYDWIRGSAVSSCYVSSYCTATTKAN